MKVSQCRQCKHHQRKVWSTSYKPSDYHTIGISHAYGYCQKYNKRCSKVKLKECEENNNDKRVL